MRYRYCLADVFTDRPFGGNPLAVFPDGRGLDPAVMQLVARELNLSETVFVLPPEDPAHTRRLRIFTPGRELPFAGHPTVGTAYILASIGDISLKGDATPIVFEEGVGPVGVTIWAHAGRPTGAQLAAARMPESGPPPPALEAIAGALSLDVADLLAGADAPEGLSCGVRFLFVPLRSRDAVRRARVDSARWQRDLRAYWAPEIFLFSYEAERPGSHIRARMFAPGLGITEDPATGAAATALAGYLAPRDPRPAGTLRWVVEQGFEMGRPSILEVEADKRGGALTAIRVGGAAVLMGGGDLEIPA